MTLAVKRATIHTRYFNCQLLVWECVDHENRICSPIDCDNIAPLKGRIYSMNKALSE